jgi:hypothetical protein
MAWWEIGRRAIWRIMRVLSEILLVLNEILRVLSEILRNHAFGGTADVIPRTFAVACVDTLLKGVDKFYSDLLHHSEMLGQVDQRDDNAIA